MTEYEAAVAVHNEALAIYRTAVAEFRGSCAGNAYAVFAAAQEARKLADAAFDAAFEIASQE